MSNRKIVEFDKTMTVFITKTSANSEVQLGRRLKTHPRDRHSKKSEERIYKRELLSSLARFPPDYLYRGALLLRGKPVPACPGQRFQAYETLKKT